MCASGLLGTRCCVRGPPGLVGNAHSGLEVASRPVRRPSRDFRLFLLCEYV